MLKQGQIMEKIKNRINSKIVILSLLQLVAMAFVFVALSDKQTIIILKEFVKSLNLDANTHDLIARIYVALKMMFDLPSLFGICVFLIQLVCATWTLKVMLFSVCPKKVMIEESKIDSYQEKIESVIFSKDCMYLENLRLLN